MVVSVSVVDLRDRGADGELQHRRRGSSHVLLAGEKVHIHNSEYVF